MSHWEMGLAYSVGSSFGYGFDPGGFVVYAATSPEKAGAVKEALLEEMGTLASDGLSAAELERAKRTFLGKMLMQRQSNAGLAEAVALEELYGLGWEHAEEQKAIVEGLELEAVNGVVASYFKETPYVTVAVTSA